MFLSFVVSILTLYLHFRDNSSSTNERLLKVLSDNVKITLTVEDIINRRLTSMVAEGATASERSDAATPHRPDTGTSRGGGGAEGGEGGDDTLHDTSIASLLSDEGLDVSQRISESLFAGPDLDADGEEIISGKMSASTLWGKVHIDLFSNRSMV